MHLFFCFHFFSTIHGDIGVNKAHTRQFNIFDANAESIVLFCLMEESEDSDFSFTCNHCNCDLVSILNFELFAVHARNSKVKRL